jgi:hypothetical protein
MGKGWLNSFFPIDKITNGLAKQTAATDFQVNQNVGPCGANQTQPKVTFCRGFIIFINQLPWRKLVYSIQERFLLLTINHETIKQAHPFFKGNLLFLTCPN